jgi:hypothetical protein
MTISCTCPKCGRVCGFRDQYAGRRARCLHCSTRFIIPEPGGDAVEVPVPAETVPEEPDQPVPGFYAAVLKENTGAFFKRESLPGVIICITLTCFHFYLGDKDYSFDLPGLRLPLIVGWVVTVITAGYLLWYLIETINEAADGSDALPEIFSEDTFAFAAEAFKSIYFFVVTFAIALIPAAVLINLLNFIRISTPWLEIPILILSMLSIPLVLSMLATGIAPWMLFRFDRIAVIIVRTFRPYLLTAVITIGSFLLIYLTLGFFATYARTAPPAALMLTARITAVFCALFAMRTIGLYARHFYPMFPELHPPEY